MPVRDTIPSRVEFRPTLPLTEPEKHIEALYFPFPTAQDRPAPRPRPRLYIGHAEQEVSQ